MNIDLHVHTRFSDGGKTTKEIIEAARKNGIKILSITDHNGYETYKKLNTYDTDDITLISGMEMDVQYKKYILHVLLYNFDINSEKIKSYDKKIRKYDIACFRKKIKQLEKLYKLKLNKNITESFIEKNQYFDLTRLNDLLVLNNICKTPSEAFYSYTKRIEGHKRKNVSLKEALKIEKNSKGILSLAHPMKYVHSIREANELILELKKKGITAIEVYNNAQTKEEENALQDIADKNNLYISGGSDYHAKFGVDEKKNIGYVLNEKIDSCKIDILDKVKNR